MKARQAEGRNGGSPSAQEEAAVFVDLTRACAPGQS